MKWLSKLCIYISCLVASLSLCIVAELTGNPYEILGVHRKSTPAEIRKAYKQLAKEWHPDKNNNPEAEEKFVQINQAYELLSDRERRKLYDDKGITDDTVFEHHDHFADHFDDFFGAHFNFQDHDITFFHKLSITTKQYDQMILPKSRKVPHLIFFYSEWCFACLQAGHFLRKIVDKLEPLGVNVVTVNDHRNPQLGRRLNIHSLPCMALILDENVYVYKEASSSVQKLIEFVRSKFPYKLVPRLKLDAVEVFLQDWKQDNRMRGLIFEPRSVTRLRYLITAYHFRHRVAFATVDSMELRRRHNVPPDMDTVLLFNENSSSPVASLTMKEIPTETLQQVIVSNQYLALPRLSSQEMFDMLCPTEWNKFKKRLCAVLITEANDLHDSHRQLFRNYALNSPYTGEKVRFAYIYREKQTEFVDSLLPVDEPFEPLLSVVILWRRDVSRVKYEWAPDKWGSEQNLTQTIWKLESVIGRLLKSNEILSHEAVIKDLLDEHASSIIGRMATRLNVFIESCYDELNKDQILPALSLVGTVIVIMVVGYYLAYLVRLEEEKLDKQKAQNVDNNNEGSLKSGYQPELRLYELRAEKYNGLVRMLKPGCRTILLILDMESRQKLIPPFHKAVWPYRKNKSLMFSYMYIERSVSWYKELLRLSLPEDRDLNINPKNCVGTVLSLNGLRKYFCMFHAKHTEKQMMRSKMNGGNVKVQTAEKDCESGSFLGFEDSSSESEAEVLLEDNLLDGLPNWLDRLFEGTTRRYHINYWPEFPISNC